MLPVHGPGPSVQRIDLLRLLGPVRGVPAGAHRRRWHRRGTGRLRRRVLLLEAGPAAAQPALHAGGLLRAGQSREGFCRRRAVRVHPAGHAILRQRVQREGADFCGNSTPTGGYRRARQLQPDCGLCHVLHALLRH